MLAKPRQPKIINKIFESHSIVPSFSLRLNHLPTIIAIKLLKTIPKIDPKINAIL